MTMKGNTMKTIQDLMTDHKARFGDKCIVSCADDIREGVDCLGISAIADRFINGHLTKARTLPAAVDGIPSMTHYDPISVVELAAEHKWFHNELIETASMPCVNPAKSSDEIIKALERTMEVIQEGQAKIDAERDEINLKWAEQSLAKLSKDDVKEINVLIITGGRGSGKSRMIERLTEAAQHLLNVNIKFCETHAEALMSKRNDPDIHPSRWKEYFDHLESYAEISSIEHKKERKPKPYFRCKSRY